MYTPDTPTCWYPGGPLITMLTLPFPDSRRYWGNEARSTCTGSCSGHYSNVLVDVTRLNCLATSPSLPPSIVLKDYFTSQTSIPDIEVQRIAKEVLLPIEDVSFWVEHLRSITENRKRGAAKAAETRRKKREKDSLCYCGKCGKLYNESTDVVELWIGCDRCSLWFCGACENLSCPPDTDLYICTTCTAS